jgi:hypothetical protein
MKSFKKYLQEFIELNNKKPESGDPHEEIKQFMGRTPFTHVTTSGDELKFKSALEAVNLVGEKRAEHEKGLAHAKKIGDTRMSEFFASSSGTHDDVLKALQDHIQDHPNLQARLREHVPSSFVTLESKARSRVDLTDTMGSDIGRRIHKSYIPAIESGRHPELFNDTHHLKGVISSVNEDPDRGYFLRKSELD